ncbi:MULTISPECIES: LeuA family protein [Brevibacillus]|uniref:LeuA family protein n=1 Tax=Brevibacillus TaxID=55080 RepID=UPI0007AB91E8|nr:MULTISPECIES: 2-isopropylmalate synthase [Brevibacillus]KZE46590.1 2-isopropylmalate synthase [Brevibacillus parabrevis]UED69201.1 2-isopropylmalate synthase [Brevibacillus sp. HD3.3A]
MKPFHILDATLREGEQQAGVRFTCEDKIRMVQLLEDFNITLIEVGHPGISAEDEEICRKVAESARRAEILMHARAAVEEVHAAKRARADWVGIWASINDVSLQTKFGQQQECYVQEKVRQAVNEAKKLGLKVRFTIEDASRTEWEKIANLGHIALQAGADRISLADTVGVLEPATCKELVTLAVEEFQCEIEVHLHNDFGLAHANALAAIDAGASVIDTTILGIGERTGITDLIQLAVSLKQLRNDNRFSLEKIPELTQAIRMTTGYRPDELRPVVGQNACTHTSAYHVQAVKRNPQAYEPFPPEMIGRMRVLEEKRPPIGKRRLPASLQVGKPFPKGASELQYHRDGPGIRWVMMDSRVDERASFYVIQRMIGMHGMPIIPEKHVDKHAHHCDSAFLFWGDAPDGTGLVCHVQLGEDEQTVESPAAIFIPAGVEHFYHYVSGSGTYTNIVMSPEYNRSLMASTPSTEPSVKEEVKSASI